MTYDEFNHFCGSLKATTYIVQWGNSHLWKVGGKVFAIGGWEKTNEPAFTFKASDLDYEILRDANGFRPAPYMASRGMKWIQQYATSHNTDEQLKYYIEASHYLASLGLTKKKQRELGLNQS
ncbi:MmcQ/YjbR family DNA-binding protein [Oceaniserpentilla sp. 4NH20-0058]|uniref:MmcQ/YjbR family DNA-binding protein n=1 Tax=Oceaniserpentilla sp. 4NH20-0058 TaxID=3127660 RepID=UPI00334283D7